MWKTGAKKPRRNAGASTETGPKDQKSGALGLVAGDFLHAGCLAAQTADVEELGAANAVAANLLHLVDDLGVEGEDALDALAKAHLAHGEAALGAILDSDDESFKGLKTLFV